MAVISRSEPVTSSEDVSNALKLQICPAPLSWLSIAVKSFKIMTTFVKPDVSTPEGTPMVTGMCKTYSFHVKRLLAECAVSEEIVKLKKEKETFDKRKEIEAALKTLKNNLEKESADSMEEQILKDGGEEGDIFHPIKLLDKIEFLADMVLGPMNSALISPATRKKLKKDYDIAMMDAKFTLGYVQPNAAKWHTKRRHEMMNKYKEEILDLYKQSDHLVTLIAVLVISLGQIAVAKYVAGKYGFFIDMTLASTVGAFFCFGFQSLNHILMHSTMNYWVKMPLALLASSCSPLPWFSYYIAGGHARHHMNAGSETDIDREALFWIWEKVPIRQLDTPLGAVLWLSAAALFLPLAYMYSMFTCAYYNWKQNKVEMAHFVTESTLTCVVFWYCGGGWSSSLYLVFSGAFSMGFLGHPYLGFWLLQHLCVYDPASPTSAQPTVSYYGDTLWNYLNYNILLHVEHHDFSKIPWHKVHTLRKIAPEYYTDLKYSTSITELMSFWIFSKGKKMDFCCEHVFGQDYVRHV